MDKENFQIDNITCGKWNWTEYEYTFQQDYGWWIHGVASISIGIIGIMVNVIFIRVLLSAEFRKILFNKLITCLTIADLIFLLCSVYDSLRSHILQLNTCSMQGYIQLLIYPIRKISMCFSIYMTVVLSLERFLAVTYPIRHRNSRIGRTWIGQFIRYVSPAFAVSGLIFGLPLFFAFKMEEVTQPQLDRTSRVNSSSKTLLIAETDVSFEDINTEQVLYCLSPWWRLDKMYILVFINITTFVVTGVIPFFLLFVLNCKIYYTIRYATKTKQNITYSFSTLSKVEKKQETEDKKNEILQSMVLFGIIISFFVCHILRVVLNLEEMIYFEELTTIQNQGLECIGVQFWAAIARDLSHFLLQVNSSINLFIYGCLSKRFKKAIKTKVFGCKIEDNENLEQTEMSTRLMRSRSNFEQSRLIRSISNQQSFDFEI